MGSRPQIYPILLNEVAATADDLAPLAFAGFAHFTALQVRGRRVKGLDLHLARLRNASIQLFDRAVSDETVRRSIRQGLSSALRISRSPSRRFHRRANSPLQAVAASRACSFVLVLHRMVPKGPFDWPSSSMSDTCQPSNMWVRARKRIICAKLWRRASTTRPSSTGMVAWVRRLSGISRSGTDVPLSGRVRRFWRER